MNPVLGSAKLMVVALQFLTRIPVFPNMEVTRKELGRCLAFFPLVGALIAMILAFIVVVLGEYLSFPINVTAALLLLVEALMTGAFHWDGLADTFDGFYSTHKSKEEMLKIMHDSRIGVMGAMSLVIIALVQYSSLSNILVFSSKDVIPILLSVYMMSKWGCVYLSVSSSYGRKEGKGLVFLEEAKWPVLLVATLFVLPLLLFGYMYAMLFLVNACFVIFWGKYSQRKVGGITGDILGASARLSETLIMICSLLFFKYF